MVGTWVLEDFTVERGGVTSHPFGERPGGMLSYTASGWMSALLTTDPTRNVSASEAPEAADGTVAYAGRWERAADGAVLHHVMYSHYAPWLGTTLERRVRLLPEGLELTATSPGGSKSILRWRRRVT
ncbi:lipocalin-like domain-containing protein [Streptomyces silvisoli]|uniref:Lipocalin-like domain-containing protein n=1 Tax=Streptomyces silvisoli TaxID=3034235 RepID=A0ABT5ZTA7_9ACTN|nr:lipocalin-like domain-containing protein [Streptomyces silvisoli]MDF3293073.1 lipocalin-like domain-containing protein [Streptomyces silvisoli]